MATKRIDEHTLQVLEYRSLLDSLATFAASPLGRSKALSLYPSTQPHWIKQRLAETTELKHLLTDETRLPLAGLHDLTVLFDRLEKKQAVFDPDELLKISDTLAGAGRLQAFFYSLNPVQYEHLHCFGDHLGEFDTLVRSIHQCIDGREGVRDEATEKLRQIRRRIHDLEDTVRRRFHQIVSAPQLRHAIENDNFLIRHGRPVVALKTHYRMMLRGTVLDRSNTGATLYVEPDELVELNNELEDTRFEEKKEIDHILWDLTHRVLERQSEILSTQTTLGFIDLTYAKARFSLAYDMRSPHIDTYMDLREARHPLLMQWAAEQNGCAVADLTSEVVPVSPRLGRDFDLLLVTGPNTGGKTVLLKTIGLCALMAQSGLHIPAGPESRIAVYHQMFADIGDEQSIQQSLSTFSAHVRQVIRILKKTNQRTLVLLDELGAGTDPTEGAALATAVLDALIARRSHTVATTHLGQLKTFAFSQPRAEIASVQFNTETLQPTYRLFIGTPGSSNALIIAETLGMPSQIVERARDEMAQQTDGSSELINQVQKTRALAERKRQKAQSLLDKARQIRTTAADRLVEINEEAQHLRDRADHEIDHTLGQVKQRINTFLNTMTNAPKPWQDEARQLAQQIHELASTTTLAQRHQAFIQSLRKGDTVYVVPLKRQGMIDRIRRKRGIMIVLVDGKQWEVGFDQIAKPGSG